MMKGHAAKLQLETFLVVTMRTQVQFVILFLAAASLIIVARPGNKSRDVNLCMSEMFPCGDDEDVIWEFDDVHSQLGCAERCTQYPECG